MDYKAAFIHTPKCAGTTIRELIKKNYRKDIAYIPGNRSKHWVRSNNQRHPGPNNKDWWYHAGDVSMFSFCFSFVRNPFDRLVSFWIFDDWHPKEMSFYKFVKWLAKQDFDYNKDTFFRWSHVMPYTHQSSILFDGMRERVDFIGKVENLDQDLKFVCEHLKLPIPAELKNERASKHLHYSRYYNKESIDIVSDIYAADLDYFNYEYEEHD